MAILYSEHHLSARTIVEATQPARWVDIGVRFWEKERQREETPLTSKCQFIYTCSNHNDVSLFNPHFYKNDCQFKCL